MSARIPVENNGTVEMRERPLRQYKIDISTENGYLYTKCTCGKEKRINPKAYMFEGEIGEFTKKDKCECGREIFTRVSMVDGRPDVRVAVTKYHIPYLGINFGMEEVPGGPDVRFRNNGLNVQPTQK